MRAVVIVGSAVAAAVVYLVVCWLLVPVMPGVVRGLGFGFLITDYRGDLHLQKVTCILPALVFGYAAARVVRSGWGLGLLAGVLSVILALVSSIAFFGHRSHPSPIPFAYPDTPEYFAHTLILFIGIPVGFALGGFFAQWPLRKKTRDSTARVSL
ncbi:MAG: hypothetical protein R6V19_02500 [Armatimonadota bacterium]